MMQALRLALIALLATASAPALAQKLDSVPRTMPARTR